MLTLVVDRYSEILPGEKSPLDILIKTSYDLEELLTPLEKYREKLTTHKVIGWGSNRFHFLNLPLYILRGRKLAYLHIDLHPDDFSIYPKINAGSFVRYIPAQQKFYIGYLKPDKKDSFSDYILVKKYDRNKILNFLDGLPDNLYVSIDLDIVKRPFVINPYNKIAPLNDREFLDLISLVLDKAKYIDFCGFQRGNSNFLNKFIELIDR